MHQIIVTIMKKALLFAALLLCIVSASADEKKYLTVAYSDVEESLILATVKKITFDASSTIITTTEGEKTYPLSEMKRITFTVDPTAINAMKEESENMKMVNGQLVVSGKGILHIYNASGQLIGLTNVDGDNKTVNLNGLQKGVYIVNLGNQTIKIQK